MGGRIVHRLALPGRSAPVRVAAGALALLMVAAVAVVVVWAGPGLSPAVRAITSPPTVTAEPAAPVAADPGVQPVGTTAPLPDPEVLAAALTPLAERPALGTFTGQVTDALTGEQLWASNPSKPQIPASTVKVLTATAALLTLDSADRVPTRVVATGEPGQVALVGGGDVTLSGQPEDSPTYYRDAPRLDDLAAQVEAAADGSVNGKPISSVLVDTTRWSGPPLALGWFPGDVQAGFTAPVEPLMLDGARTEALETDPPRSATPSLDAGRALARRLGVPEAGVGTGRSPDGARTLGQVESAPLGVRAQDAVTLSDNLAAEALGREVALASGREPTFAGAAEAIGAALEEAGFDVAGLTLQDASGLSVNDRAPAGLLTSVLTAAAGDGPLAETLRPLLTWLPVAGATGTLADRYADAPSSGGAGFVRAKTGSLTGVSTLAGTVVDVDGRVLVFALMSNGYTGDIRPTLDAMAGLLRSCGCRPK